MYGFLKRFFDIVLSLVAIIVFSWLLIIIAVAIVVEDKGNILFKKKKKKKNKKEFYIYKFRTMKVSTPKDVPTHLLDNPESYITKIGGFLRKTSLDELPQLFNILKGDMSIVGPRPALWNQFDLIALRDENGSNSVRPGLTGWAQVNGRDELPIDVKAGFDGEYIKKMSIIFDIKIILMTVVSVFTSKGVREGRNESSNNR